MYHSFHKTKNVPSVAFSGRWWKRLGPFQPQLSRTFIMCLPPQAHPLPPPHPRKINSSSCTPTLGYHSPLLSQTTTTTTTARSPHCSARHGRCRHHGSTTTRLLQTAFSLVRPVSFISSASSVSSTLSPAST